MTTNKTNNKYISVTPEELEKIERYFLKFPQWASWCIGIGAICLLIGIAGSVFMFIIAIFGIASGIFGIISFKEIVVADSVFDGIVNREKDNLYQLALDKCGLDKDDCVKNPVRISGIRISGTGGAEIQSKLGSDNIIRYTPHHIAIINFTKNYLSIYTCCLDLITGNALNVTTDEYFYKDVVSVSTEVESVTIQNVPEIPWHAKGGIIGEMKQRQNTTISQENTDEWFVLTTSGGTKTRICLSSNSLIKQNGNGQIPTTEAEEAIAVIRKLVRDKKSN